MQIKTIICVFLAVSFVLFPTLAQETTDETVSEVEGDALKRAKAEEGVAEASDKVYTVTADETEGSFSAAGKTIHVIGNVVITHGKTTITCNEAWSYEAEKLFTLKGKVKVVDTEQDYILTSDYAEYHRDTEVAVASKGPVLTLKGDKDIVITSDIMRMNMKTEYGEAAGNCEVESEDITAVGDTLHYYGGEENERIILDGSPVVWQGDSRLAGQLITMYLSGDDIDRVLVEEDAHLVYFAKEEESEEEAELNETLDAELGLTEGEVAAEPREDTEIDYVVDGGEAIEVIEFADDVEDDTVELFGGDPDYSEAAEDEVVAIETGENDEEEEKVNGKVEAIGDVIDALFIDGEIDKVIVDGDARGIYSPYDEFGALTGEEMDTSGDIITMSFREGAARKILVEGDAVGVYNPGEAGGRAGLTRSEGDTISIYISNNDVRRMVVFGSARGSYFTEETVAEEEGQADAAKRDGGPQNN